MARHNEFGKWGEDVAARYLQDNGFEIMARNWRYEHLEIDIIAQKESTLYFVEVKTRHGEVWNAEDAITDKKRGLMQRALIAWKLQHPSRMPVCMSAIAVVKTDEDTPPEVRWHDNVWEL
ncbi:MAG: YraN family protein [Bacteroidaceae bacterium]|nr:YraN family protein [Bacteroidaceae bacterium]